MRRLCLSFALAACGPAVDSGSGSGNASASTGGGTTAEASTTDGVTTGVSTGTSAPTLGSPSDSPASSSSGEPFEMGDVLGTWLCAADDERFALGIDEYPAPQQLGGRICANWNGEINPQQWGPCGELTSHPLGGGTNLWIYAIIMGDRRESWTINASLIYDVKTDSLMGTWAGTGGEKDGNELTCSRL